MSHQNIIRITEKAVEEFKQWKRRDLSTFKVAYLILDGTMLAVRAGTREKEAVLVAWGFLEDFWSRYDEGGTSYSYSNQGIKA